MKVGKVKSLLVTLSGCFYAIFAYSATSLFSNYGQIQNVQNYSTNPFWTPNSPYNQKLPQPVYVQGNSVTNDECIQIVKAAVVVQCAAHNNCKNTSLTDIRPGVIIQLSNLPNKAYSTACIGYLDTVYESYVAENGGGLAYKTPTVTTATSQKTYSNNNNQVVLNNPYAVKTTKWQQEINERTQELAALQRQNGVGGEALTATAIPLSYEDLSFSQRLENDKAGYAPYKDKKAYKIINVKNASQWCDGEHQDSPECLEYFCSAGGSKASTEQCIKWRCSKSDYANAHQMECLCQKGLETGFKCMSYKCNESAEKNTQECKKWLCDNNVSYKKNNKKTCDSLITFKAGFGGGSGGGFGGGSDGKLCLPDDKTKCCDQNKANDCDELCKNDKFAAVNKDTVCKVAQGIVVDEKDLVKDLEILACINNLNLDVEITGNYDVDIQKLIPVIARQVLNSCDMKVVGNLLDDLDNGPNRKIIVQITEDVKYPIDTKKLLTFIGKEMNTKFGVFVYNKKLSPGYNVGSQNFCTNNELHTPGYKKRCEILPTSPWWSNLCSDHEKAWNLTDNAPINVAGRTVFKGDVNSSDEYVIDDNWGLFRGLILEDVDMDTTDITVLFDDLVEAYTQMVRFSLNVKSHANNSYCSGLMAYLVSVGACYAGNGFNGVPKQERAICIISSDFKLSKN